MIDAQSISAAMFADNALTLDELEKVQSKRKRAIKAAQSLLNLVLKQSSDVHGCFLNALYKSGDEGKELYKLILEDHCKSMTQCQLLSIKIHTYIHTYIQIGLITSSK